MEIIAKPRVVFALKVILRGTLRSLAQLPVNSHISVNLQNEQYELCDKGPCAKVNVRDSEIHSALKGWTSI
jgi:hypothetical protein